MADTYKNLTPMLRQYFDIKAERPDVVLLMRVGDFYEAYGEDAETIARELEITLTGRELTDARVPMAGVPHHALERYSSAKATRSRSAIRWKTRSLPRAWSSAK